MNGFEFFAAIIDSLAWPAALFGMLFLFRRQVAALLPYMERLRYKDFELEFRESVHQLAEESKDLMDELKEEKPIEEGPLDFTDCLYQLSEISPRAAILEAWLNVEANAVAALRARKIAPEEIGKIVPLKIARMLQKTQTLGQDEMEIFHKLRSLRNRAVHLGEVNLDPIDVAEYIDLALFLTRRLRMSSHPSRINNDC